MAYEPTRDPELLAELRRLATRLLDLADERDRAAQHARDHDAAGIGELDEERADLIGRAAASLMMAINTFSADTLA